MWAAALLGRCWALAPSLPAPCRSLSTAVVAATLEEQLQHAPWLQLLPVPGAGRGLFAAQDIEQGMVVHMEAPMLCAPSPHALDSTCHHCLMPLPPGAAHHRPAITSAAATSTTAGTSSNSSITDRGIALHFCSSSCSDAAGQSWAQAAAACDFSPLHQACLEGGDKFPLMLAHLACLKIQSHWEQHQQHPSSTSSSNSGGGVGSTGAPAGAVEVEAAGAAGAPAKEGASRGDPLTQLRHLCFANLAAPPPPWVHMHQLLLQGLQHLCSVGTSHGGVHSSSTSASSSTSSTSGGGSRLPAVDRQWLEQQCSLQWFCDAMARLHLNSFRVDTVPPLDPSDPAAMLRAAAASLSGAAQPTHHTGSAAYLLASLLNHSCEPNLDISFPDNNALVSFTAARDIGRNDQLTISYIDAGQGVQQRRAALEFGYGFTCRCPRCVEEAEEAGQE